LLQMNINICMAPDSSNCQKNQWIMTFLATYI
jgi:hypothetical protein